jgi:protein-disulfide isomerase
METEKKKDWLLPASILIAALLVSMSLVYSAGKQGNTGSANLAGSQQGQEANNPSLDNVRPVTADDHIRGNPDAPVKIVEFSDLECPFCKSFHPTMEQVVADYNGQVAWVYRHFPLDNIHPWARPAAEASECVAALAGNDAFWTYIDRVFAAGDSGGFNQSIFSDLAVGVGVNGGQFDSCFANATYRERVEADLQNAIDSGGRGTPYSILIAQNGQKTVISGAQPITNVKAIIDQVLGQ